jgi:hypothetical protein
MNPFDKFIFSMLHAERGQTVGSVMPANKGFSNAVVFTEAYLRKSKADVLIRGFSDLLSVMDDVSPLGALMRARSDGSLTEGKKWLSPEMTDYLLSVSGNTFYIRCSCRGSGPTGYSKISVASLNSDIISSQPCHEGEFEICDSNGTLYFRFRDDEPVMFLAARADIVSELTRLFADNVHLVEPDFIYCS